MAGNRQTLVAWIKQDLYNHEIPQTKLAKKLKMDTGSLNKILNGKQNFSVDKMYEIINAIELIINNK